MAENNFGKGIKITSGFDLSAKLPLDNRYIVKTLEERDAHVTNNRAYEGMKVYVLDEKKEYIYNGTEWTEQGGISDEQLEQLTIAYQHSQSKHITIEDIHTHDNKSVLDNITQEKVNSWDNKSEFDGNYNNLTNKPIIPTKTSELTNDSSLATETYVINKIAEAELNDKEVDLSGYATKDELHNHTNKTILDGITSDKITSWDNKSNFDGNYNSLTNKPTIPSIDGLASETYVDTKTSSITDSINDLEKIETSNIEPTDKKVSIWINTSEETPTNVIARINDDTVASNTTWSSEKINQQIIDLTEKYKDLLAKYNELSQGTNSNIYYLQDINGDYLQDTNGDYLVFKEDE